MQFYCCNLSLKGLMSSRPGCFGHLHQGCQPGSWHFLHGRFFSESFRRRSMQGKGNSGALPPSIVQVKPNHASKMTFCSYTVLCLGWAEKSHLGTGLEKRYSQRSGHTSLKSHILLLKLWGWLTAWPLQANHLPLLALFPCLWVRADGSDIDACKVGSLYLLPWAQKSLLMLSSCSCLGVVFGRVQC